MQLDTKDKIILSLVVVLIIGVLISIIQNKIQQNNFNDKIKELNNTMAKTSETIKIDDNVYEKISLTQEKLIKTYLEEQDKKLSDKFEDLNQKLLAVTKAQITIKDQVYKIDSSSGGKINQVIIEKEKEEKRLKVTFEKIQGYFKVSGYTLTNPLEAEINITQAKQLYVMTGLVKQDDGRYYAFLKFPDDFPITNISLDSRIDIEEIISEYKEKWYQRFYMGGSFFVSKKGVVIGPFIGYKLLGKLLIGPTVVIDTNTELYYGINMFYNIGVK